MPEKLVRRIAGAAIASLILASSLVAPGRAQDKVGTSLDPQNFGQIERGRYLAIVGDCASCHTVPGSGQPYAGGRPIETPFGVVVGANITPDPDTGIGAWTDQAFVLALREGKENHGQLLYPAMPYPYYTKVTEGDALAIRAYLNTVKPIHNAVVSNKLPFPFDVREGMAAWNALYFRSGEFKPVPTKSADWNRGAYLVEGPGHCGACHTPKTRLGGDDRARVFQGYALQGWFAPNITDDNERGLGGWSIADIVAYLKAGHNAASAATGIMGEEITLSSSQMTDADLTAIATYLKDLPGQTSSPPPAALPASDPRMIAGGAIYLDECTACHGADGKGVPFLFPSVAGSPNVRSTDPASLIHVVIEGARSVATHEEPTGPGMPSFAWKLSDDQAAAVLTYIR
ncbi:MAG: c-type cytochrome, partial [Hyphomicrobiales bacterium]|nr:c-type cytochrome [Hyphomicrobiales bacterium]MBV9910105.1 c-type cytochrome [Hyphomicrobiales bacterium]